MNTNTLPQVLRDSRLRAYRATGTFTRCNNHTRESALDKEKVSEENRQIRYKFYYLISEDKCKKLIAIENNYAQNTEVWIGFKWLGQFLLNKHHKTSDSINLQAPGILYMWDRGSTVVKVLC